MYTAHAVFMENMKNTFCIPEVVELESRKQLQPVLALKNACWDPFFMEFVSFNYRFLFIITTVSYTISDTLTNFLLPTRILDTTDPKTQNGR